RFLVAAGRRFPNAELLGVEVDPLAALTARGHLAAAGLASRGRVATRDFRALRLAPKKGTTVFLGNPPYVRHHALDARWKQWLTRRATARGLPVSQLAGLHVHFLLAIAELARPGDVGVLVTSAEWLDTRYGVLARSLLLGPLGLLSLDLFPPSARPF